MVAAHGQNDLAVTRALFAKQDDAVVRSDPAQMRNRVRALPG